MLTHLYQSAGSVVGADQLNLSWVSNSTIKGLKIGTPKTITIIILKMELPRTLPYLKHIHFIA